MRDPRPPFARYLELAVAVIMLAILVMLVSGTLEPLESPPRAGRANSAEQVPGGNSSVDGPESGNENSDDRGRRARRNREERQESSPPAATPAP